MGDMKMPLPANTLPMMSGDGPFGNLEMGGMFTVLKVREGLKRGDYSDPGWYRHPAGTVAREWAGDGAEALPPAPRAPDARPAPAPAGQAMDARKPGANDMTGHEHH
jgi:hypothetical protein